MLPRAWLLSDSEVTFSCCCQNKKAELSMDFQQGLDWLVSYTDPLKTWQNEPTYLGIQFVVIFGVLLNFIHACRCGGRYVHLWFATIVVSIVTELVCYLMPNLNNFWHAQGVLMFAGRRFPLYIVLVYNQFWYTAYVAVARARLSWWAEPFATGLLAVLLDLPYDIMGVRMLWWSWHDTDPNIYDRHMHVPWTSYYFHSSFVAMLLIVFFGSRKILMPHTSKWGSGNIFLEILCTVLSGVLAMPLASLVFITIFYNTLHGLYDIHSEVPVLMWLTCLGLITWCSDRRPGPESRRDNISSMASLPVVNVLQYFTFFIVLMFVAKPEEVRSTGLHQQVGDCNKTELSFTITGEEFLRPKHLCIQDYMEPFDFGCLAKDELPKPGQDWYTLCGLPYENAMEYKFVVWFACATGLFVFIQFLLFSGSQPEVQSGQTKKPSEATRGKAKSQQQHKKKNKKTKAE